MSYTKREREYYNIDRNKACERLGITKNQYNWLRRKGEELRKVYENNCNGLYKTDGDYITACAGLESAIIGYAGDLCVYFQTDPRGPALYIDREPIPENDYTRAVCIY